MDGKAWRDGGAQGEESGLYLEDPVCFRKVMSAEGLYFRKLTAVWWTDWEVCGQGQEASADRCGGPGLCQDQGAALRLWEETWRGRAGRSALGRWHDQDVTVALDMEHERKTRWSLSSGFEQISAESRREGGAGILSPGCPYGEGGVALVGRGHD